MTLAHKNIGAVITLILISTAIGIWYTITPPPPQQLQYYADLLCVASHQQPQADKAQLRHIMQSLVEKNNNDYALRQNTFQGKAADHVLRYWQQLTTQQKTQYNQDPERCYTTIANAIVSGE